MIVIQIEIQFNAKFLDVVGSNDENKFIIIFNYLIYYYKLIYYLMEFLMYR